jgi:Tfp pilus assembly protein PilE
MDRLKSIARFSARSSTLIEVIVALIIISAISGTAIMIYLNVQRSGLSAARISAMMMMDQVYAASKTDQKFETKEVNYGDVVVYQTVTTQPVAGLLMIRLEARNSVGKLMAEQKHLIYAPPVE